ncbi:MAG: inositol monophosphatase family protein [Myxococcota bacterium]
MDDAPFDLGRLGGRRGLDLLVDEVLAAGDLALGMQRDVLRGEGIERKADASPVTVADRAVEERLRAHVAAHHPEAGWLGEETGRAGEGAALRFVVDPIDGTRAFLRGLATWSVLVAVEAEGEPVVGIAYLPAAGDLFVGVRGGGAYANGRPCRLSSVDALGEALVSHGALAQFTDVGLEAALPALARGTYTQRGFADFAGYAALLRGQADAVVDPGVQPYDVAPAAVLVREAGGRATDLRGVPTVHGEGFVASNGLLHDALLALVGPG